MFSLHMGANGLLAHLISLVVTMTIEELAVAGARAGMEGDRTLTLRLPATMMPCRRDVTVWKSREERRGQRTSSED